MTLPCISCTNQPTSPEKNWLHILEVSEQALPYIEKTYGPYPYKQYSFIHGGDGGMEYPMATLLKGRQWIYARIDAQLVPGYAGNQ